MRAISRKIRIALNIAAILLAIMTFPSTSYGKEGTLSPSREFSKSEIDQHHFFLTVQHLGRKLMEAYSSRRGGVTPIDDDVRIRAATALVSDPELARHATKDRSHIRILVITANPLLSI